MLTSNPSILGLAMENIRGKLSDLRALGFADPVKMVTSNPSILGLAMENIRGKLSDLRALGFADPVKMITSIPTILGYSIENIRGRLSDLRALGFADPVKMVAGFPTILGYARERLLLCGRIVMHLDDAKPGMLAMLINKRRTVIDAVAAAEPRSWSAVRAIIAANRSKRG